MSKLFIALLLCFASTFAVAAPPKTLWEADYDYDKRAYTVRPRGKASTPTSFEDTKAAIDKNVQRGEWFIDRMDIAPRAQHKELLERLKRRGATVIRWTEVTAGTIVEANKHVTVGWVTRGMPRSMRVDVTNWSPTAIRATTLWFTTSCGPQGSVKLAKPLAIGPDSTVRVTIDAKDIVPFDAPSISCTYPDSGWHRDVHVEFEV